MFFEAKLLLIKHILCVKIFVSKCGIECGPTSCSLLNTSDNYLSQSYIKLNVTKWNFRLIAIIKEIMSWKNIKEVLLNIRNQLYNQTGNHQEFILSNFCLRPKRWMFIQTLIKNLAFWAHITHTSSSSFHSVLFWRFVSSLCYN